MKDEELVATDRHDDCVMRTIRATMQPAADDAEHRSSSLTLSQWLVVLNVDSWDDQGCATLQVCGVGSVVGWITRNRHRECWLKATEGLWLKKVR